jgi:hypothetical protein
MTLQRTATLVLFTVVLASRPIGAAEPRTTSYEEPRTYSSTIDPRLYDDTQYRLVDGKLVPVTDTRSGGANPAPQEPEPVTLPFEHFNADDDGSSIINSYFLAYLSMLVYSGETNIADFELELAETLLPQGVVDVRAFMNSYGVEGAVVCTDDAAIIVFRGTSSIGSYSQLADYLADANDAPQKVKVGGKEVYVHEGFWGAANSIYPVILAEILDDYLAGRKIWVTGHSLGAAVATLTAARLHYDAGITVQGLQTFGSPRVGDLAFALTAAGANGTPHALEDVTVRWVVHEDPVTTFWEKEAIGFNWWGTIWVYYQHIGVTNTIYPLEDGGFDVKYDTGENKKMYWNLAGLGNQHMAYLEGLAYEMTMVVSDDVLEDILLAP